MTEPNTVAERLREYIDHKGMTVSSFCHSLSASKAWISSMRKSISVEKIQSIALLYPDLNIVWLLTGHEQMLKTDASSALSPILTTDNSNMESPGNLITLLNEIIKERDEEIIRLRLENMELVKELSKSGKLSGNISPGEKGTHRSTG